MHQKDQIKDDNLVPFELLSLEAILESVFRDLDRAVSRLTRDVEDALKKVVGHPTPAELEAVRVVKNLTDNLCVMAFRRDATPAGLTFHSPHTACPRKAGSTFHSLHAA